MSDKPFHNPEAQRVIIESVADVHIGTGRTLTEDGALIVAWERSVLAVSAGAHIDSDESLMYGAGRREILRRMGAFDEISVEEASSLPIERDDEDKDVLWDTLMPPFEKLYDI